MRYISDEYSDYFQNIVNNTAQGTMQVKNMHFINMSLNDSFLKIFNIEVD